eukprot:gene7652-7855_t
MSRDADSEEAEEVLSLGSEEELDDAVAGDEYAETANEEQAEAAEDSGDPGEELDHRAADHMGVGGRAEAWPQQPEAAIFPQVLHRQEADLAGQLLPGGRHLLLASMSQFPSPLLRLAELV